MKILYTSTINIVDGDFIILSCSENALDLFKFNGSYKTVDFGRVKPNYFRQDNPLNFEELFYF
ncbi:MAG: hypothetical protein LBT66_09120 [Methanobrevibacter sp.]|nr:hypothetical protein [Candidatus Methanovirga meridionalis]